MRFSAIIHSSYRALRINIGRSLLTILGIVIGVMAIVLVISLGEGAQGLILSEVEGIGADTIVVRPGREPQGPNDIAETILADSIRDRDVAALERKENVPGILSVQPAVLVSGIVTYQEELFRPTTFGWTPSGIEEVFGISATEGALFTEDDITQRARVAVIGWRVREELFGESDAVGQSITIQDQKVRVVGVLPKSGQVSLLNVDELVVLPYSTAQKTILGIDHYHELFIKAAPGEDVDQVAEDIRITLRELHGITDPEKDDFFVTTQQEALETISTITQTLTIFLVAIASIALVVGGIGIMNIMLVSVTERTREIGLRKAVGATHQDILTQFLIEAVMLTATGGVLGTILALSISALVAYIIREQFSLNWEFTLPVGAVVLGVGVAAAIGLIFGIFPARKAARKNPIEALRYE